MPLEAYLSKSALWGRASYYGGGLIRIRCLLICVKNINKALLMTQNSFQRIIYETILITQHVLINNQIKP